VKTYLPTTPARVANLLFRVTLFAAGLFLSTQLFAQCVPVFANQSEDITLSCTQSAPPFDECSAATSQCCPGPVTVSSFVSQTGSPISTCTISTAFGPGIDWALWFPLLDAPSVAWNFVGPAYLEEYTDGSAHLWGTIANAGNTSLMMEVDMWFANGANWNDWSALGRSYKDDLQLGATTHLDWKYYELKEGYATVNGIGLLAGSQLHLHHKPANYYFGFQSGMAANNKNSNAGFSGWFSYDGVYDGLTVIGHGDVNVDKACEDNNGECGSTAFTKICRAEDACGNVAFQSQTISLIDDTPPVVNDYEEIISLLCTDYQGIFITATDNCSEFTITYTDDVVVTGCNGQVIRHYTITDGCGNSTTADQIINLFGENDLAFINFPEDIMISCSEVDLIPSPDVMWEGGCANVILSVEDNLIPGACDGTYTITHTYTLVDDCDNTISQTWTIQVTDTTPPVLFNIPADITIGCGDPVPDANAFAIDACSENVNISIEASTNYLNCGYIFTRTWVATDDCGNVATASQVITVEDDVNPYFLFWPPSVTVNCDEPFELEDPVYDDECSVTTLITVDIPLGDCAGSFIRVFRVFDGCGNQAIQNTLVTKIDTTPPTMLNFPEDITTNCGAIPTAESADLEYSDNCGSVTVDFEETEMPAECGYAIVRTWTLTDDCGNSSEWTWTITVGDDEAPTLIGVPEDAATSCGDDVEDAVVTAIDNCDSNVTITLEATTSPLDCGYNFIRTWTATDACGNSTMASQTIAVSDDVAPVWTFIPQDINLACGSGITIDDLPLAEAYDECTDASVTYVDQPLGGNCGDGILRTFFASDLCGNSITTTQLISFNDDEAPIFTLVPTDVIAECGTDIVLNTPVATDNCSGAIITFIDTPNSACAGSYTRVYTATDACGNSTSVSVNVIFTDDEAPVFTNTPANADYPCNDVPTADSANITYTDNCGAVDVSFNETIIEGNCPSNYIILRTWTLEDDCGNTAQFTWTLNVTDTEAPMLTGLPPHEDLFCGQTAQEGLVVAIDNCDENVNVSLTAETIQLDCGQIFVRTWTAIDACGNIATENVEVEIFDIVPPVFTFVPADILGDCTSENPIDPPLVLAEATDDCSPNVVVTYEDIPTTSGCGLNITRVFTATDNCGNSSTAIQLIVVSDGVSPEFTFVPADIAVPCGSPIDLPMATAADECSAVTVTFTDESFINDCAGGIIRTYTATDGCSNTADINVTVTFIDDDAPMFTSFPNDLTINCDEVPSIDEANIAYMDACGSPVFVMVEETIIDGDCANSYMIVRNYTITDGCGNSTSQSWTIQVLDETPPVIFNVPQNTTINCGDPIEEAVVMAVDNCSSENNISISLHAKTSAQPCGYIFIRVWTATDECGNSTQATQEITVLDTVAPFFTYIPEPVILDCGEPLVLESAMADDLCSDVIVTDTLVLINDYKSCDGQIYLHTFTATDGCGNKAYASVEVIVEDFQAPFPSSYVSFIEATCDNLPVIDENYVTFTDNCDDDIDVLFTTDINEGECPNSYTIIHHWIATDNNCNQTDELLVISVQDNTAPAFDFLPQDMTLQCTDPFPLEPNVTATDNCSGLVTLTFTENTINGSCPSNYTLERTWTAVDECGNANTHTQTIEVVDSEGPEFIDFQTELTLPCTGINGLFATAADNCNPFSMTYNDVLIGTSCNGTVERTYTATDVCGNVSVAVQTIMLFDNDAPIIEAFPADITVDCGNVPTPSEANIEYIDYCSFVTISMEETVTAGICINNYVLERAYTLSDACGNTVSQTWTITVVDDAAPQLMGVPDDITIDCTEFTSLPPVNVFGIDNCTEDPTVSLSATSEDTECGLIFTRTWTVTDACGNISTDSQVITVTDFFPPTLSQYPADATLNCGETAPTAPEITAFDNCDDNVTVTFSEQSFGNIDCPNIVRTWCAMDCSGNEECHEQTILFILPATNNEQAQALMHVTGNVGNTPAVTVKSAKAGVWKLQLFSTNGQLISSIFEGAMDQEQSKYFTLDISGLKDSMYFVRFTDGTETITQKLVLIH
jgi:large repetitive protein